MAREEKEGTKGSLGHYYYSDYYDGFDGFQKRKQAWKKLRWHRTAGSTLKTCNLSRSSIFTFFSVTAYEDIGKKPKPNANHVECSFDNMPGEDQFCQVKTSELITGPCTEDNHFGFDQGKPCILIKLNKVRLLPNTLHNV